jgi:hypothetical protein
MPDWKAKAMAAAPLYSEGEASEDALSWAREASKQKKREKIKRYVASQLKANGMTDISDANLSTAALSLARHRRSRRRANINAGISA